MEHNEIEILVEKYYNAETSIDEENILRLYFAGDNVATNLLKYKPMFSYITEEKTKQYDKKIMLKSKTNKMAWFSVAASLIAFLGLILFYNSNNEPLNNKDLGTYQDPEIAFRATQKALSLLSTKVNIGIKGASHLQEYELAKERIFK